MAIYVIKERLTPEIVAEIKDALLTLDSDRITYIHNKYKLSNVQYCCTRHFLLIHYIDAVKDL
jgi:hypothetical protein